MGDDAGLLNDVLGVPRESEKAIVEAGKEPAVKRQCLRKADYLGSQIFMPHGPSSIEKAQLPMLWQVVEKGNKWTQYHSYLANPDKVRQGVAISQFAQTLKHSIRHFREGRMKLIMKPEFYEKIEK